MSCPLGQCGASLVCRSSVCGSFSLCVCRRCGQVFCSDCTATRIALATSEEKPVRVCTACVKAEKDRQTAAVAAASGAKAEVKEGKAEAKDATAALPSISSIRTSPTLKPAEAPSFSLLPSLAALSAGAASSSASSHAPSSETSFAFVALPAAWPLTLFWSAELASESQLTLEQYDWIWLPHLDYGFVPARLDNPDEGSTTLWSDCADRVPLCSC